MTASLAAVLDAALAGNGAFDHLEIDRLATALAADRAITSTPSPGA
jgi:hypothetical protein